MKPLLPLIFCASLIACADEPIVWSNTIDGVTAPSDGYTTRPVDQLVSTRACPASTRTAASGSIRFAAWWEVRSDSSAVLTLARSTPDGSAWEQPVAADTTDRGARGCSRFPPAISADSASGYVHLAYFIEPVSGGGIFYAHSMDNGQTLHAPVPIVFGRNQSRVSIASTGDRVVVAYEDPNSVKPGVALALSRTMGHIFEQRVRASPENVRAKQPIVSVSGDTVDVWWSVYSVNPTISATTPGFRRGMWK